MDFRKSLITTSAICAAGVLAANAAVAAEKPKLNITGYLDTIFGVGSQDRDQAGANGTPTYSGANEEFGIVQYGEIRFSVEGMTDSGMKWGAYFEDVQDDADTAGKKASTDEVNLWLSGSWGKVEIGGQDGAADRMAVYGRDLAYTDRDYPSIWGDVRGNAVRGDDLTSIDDTSDDTKVTYYTPRFNGFQGGYSFVPSSGAEGSVASSASESHEAAIAWRGKFDGVSIETAAAYSLIDNGDSFDSSDNEAYSLGATVGFGPYSVGASYVDNGRKRNAADQTAWDASVAFDGGKWGVALTYFSANGDPVAAGLGEEDFTMWQLSGGYNLGGGLSLAAGLYFWELDANVAADDNDGMTALMQVSAKF